MIKISKTYTVDKYLEIDTTNENARKNTRIKCKLKGLELPLFIEEIIFITQSERERVLEDTQYFVKSLVGRLERHYKLEDVHCMELYRTFESFNKLIGVTARIPGENLNRWTIKFKV